MKGSTVLAIGLILIALASPLWNSKTSTPAWTPSLELQQAVTPVRKLLEGSPQEAKRLAAFYDQFAGVIKSDSAVIQTTGQLREGHIRAGKLCFPDLKGKIPGLARAVDRVLGETIGLDNIPLDQEKRRQTVDTLRAIAWACRQ